MAQLNVAIADDNEKMVQLLGDIVKSDKELNVVGIAKDGVEACEMIRTKEPDIVLLDIVMPKLDGLGVLTKINNDRSIKKHPAFIVISAIGQEKITEDAFSLGADYYIMKPFDNEMVINQIKLIRDRSIRRVNEPRKVNAYEKFQEPAESVYATPELAKKYPLNVIPQHPAFRTHSQYYNLPWIQEIEGPARIFMSREDAAARGIQDGDLVRIFNDRGELKNIIARVGVRVKSGVIEMSSGMWVKLGGSVNKLTGVYPAGPRDILQEHGIMQEYHPLLDGNTGSYFNTLVEVQKM